MLERVQRAKEPILRKQNMTTQRAANILAMNTLRFDENCFIRSIVHSGKTYFSSCDICITLGYSNVAHALNDNCRQDYIVEMKDIASSLGDIEL